MTQAKHTPWDFLVNDGEWEVFDTRGHTVAYNLTEANARLIAAAPELLEALNEINNWLVCSCIATPEDMAQSFPHMQSLCEAAIAKATGA